ncbi:hypothetical protein GJ496_005228 [Pomphorhynchus laevis]|nr:hypothetical protein GJ496_005228 [Pomphorhynchus laevis]
MLQKSSILERNLLKKAFYDLYGEENRKGKNKPKYRAESLLSKLDNDNDSMITREEFIDGCLRNQDIMFILAPTSLL